MEAVVAIFKLLHPALVLRLLVLRFSFNAICQFVPLLNFRAVIFDLTSFGWVLSVPITPHFLWGYI